MSWPKNARQTVIYVRQTLTPFPEKVIFAGILIILALNFSEQAPALCSGDRTIGTTVSQRVCNIPVAQTI